MALNMGSAFGNVASGIAETLNKRADDKHAEEKKNRELVSTLVAEGLKSGKIKDPDAAFRFFLKNLSGKSGKKPIEMPPMLKSIIGGIKHLGGKGGGESEADQVAGRMASAPKPGGQGGDEQAPGIHFLTEGESTAQGNAAQLDLEKKRASEISEPAAAKQHTRRMEELELQGKGKKGTRDKTATQNAEGKWVYNVRGADGEVIYEEPAQAPRKPGKLGQRIDELVAKGANPDQAEKLAAEQLETERRTTQAQASTRLDAYMKSSRAALLANQERLMEMQQSFPYLLATRISNSDTANFRAAINEYKAATVGPGASATKAYTAAAKIVQQATKQAATLASKQSTVLTTLGIDPDEATIRRNLIQEMSGGEDPTKIEALARQAVAVPEDAATPDKEPSKPGAANKTPSKEQDTPKRRIDARKYLQSNNLKVTEANIAHYLVNAPVEAAPAAAAP
jgi:hypothetical protein